MTILAAQENMVAKNALEAFYAMIVILFWGELEIIQIGSTL